MKKLLALVLLVAFTTFSFGQKNEVKAIEKALKNSNFADAKSAVAIANALEGSMDGKTKAKFYFLKAQALYANGTGTDTNIDEAIIAINQLKELESSMGKLRYTEEANLMKDGMFKSFLEKANQALTKKDYKTAAQRFDKIYKMSQDTLYLYYAASSAVNDQDFDTSLKHYLQLKSMGFSGEKMNYYATNKETKEEELFGDKASWDFSVKTIKTHIKPRKEKSASKKGEIVKNIALIYVSQGEDAQALAAMADARAENPHDLGLLLSEANVHLKMGNRDKFKALMEEATQKDPNNSELQFNLGVLAAEGDNIEAAKEYYQKALTIDPNYVNAYINIAVVILEGEAGIVEEMNGLGTSAADNRKYDELKAKRSKLYQEAIPYLEKALELKKSNVNTARTLMNIYSAIGETDKFKVMKARVEVMEASAGGN